MPSHNSPFEQHEEHEPVEVDASLGYEGTAARVSDECGLPAERGNDTGPYG